MRRLLALVALCTLLSGCEFLRVFAPPLATGIPTASPRQAELTILGNQSGPSATFPLVGGDYEVRYGASADSPADCINHLTLETDDSGYSAEISDGHRTGATFLGDVPAGSYFVFAMSTCQWEVTLTLLS